MKTVRLSEIKSFLQEKGLDFKFEGSENIDIEGFSSLYNYKKGTVTWCKTTEILENKAKDSYTLLIAPKYIREICDICIITDDPKTIFFTIIEKFFCEDEELPAIGHGTFISDKVKIGKNVKIGHNCVLDGNITIGDDTIIYNNISIINTVEIGDKCVIQSGTVIGHDCYAYIEDNQNNKHMIKHYGGVVIEDDVWIGCCCVINRGTIDNTVIGEGSKLDDYCHISHNVELGAKSALISGAKLYGSVKTGENVYVASSIVKNQIKLGNNVTVGMGSLVLKDVEDNLVVIGTPAKPLIK